MKPAVLAGVLVLVSALGIVGFGLSIAAFIKAKDNSSPRCVDESGTTATAVTTVTTSVASTPTQPAGSSDGWKEVARILKESMNTSADPCDDFFEYSCGGWNKAHPIPKGYDSVLLSVVANALTCFSYYVYSYMQDLVYAAVNKSLYDISDFENSNAMKYSKKIYLECLKTQQDGTDFTMNVVEKIRKSYGGMPLIHSNATIGNPFAILGRLMRDEMMGPLLAGSVGVDAKHIDTHALTLDRGSLGMYSIEFYLDKKTYAKDIDDYKEKIRSVIASLNSSAVEEGGRQVEEFIDNVLRFETDVAMMINEHYPDVRNHSAMYNPVPVSDLIAEDPNYGDPWGNYSDAILKDTGISKLADDANVILTSKEYFMWLAGFVQDVTNDDDKFLQNYFMLQYALQRKEFMNVTESKSVGEATKYCSDYIVNMLVFAAGRAYIQEAADALKPDAEFGEADRNLVGEVTLMIRKAFGDQLSELSWMSEDSKNRAHFKLANMAQTIGWPAWIFDEVLLDAYHEGFDLSGTDNFFDMFSIMTRFFSRTFLIQLEKSVNRHDFQMSPALVNAWYEPTYNSITIPGAILRAPQYRKDFPMAFNYGSTGNTPGHEITHGFDDEGVQYDWNGELNTWMDVHSQMGFKNMSECVVKQYGNFCYNIDGQKICINGKQTQGENIADNGGIRAAYNAYMRYVGTNGEEPRLPGLEDLTMEQIYFISYGYSWCGAETDENLKKRLFTNPHSPPRDRVIGTLQNFEAMGQAFNCKKGSRMYPNDDKRCDVWWSS